MSSRPSGYVLLDGQPVAGERAVVSVFDRGLMYGHAVFETLRVYGGNPFELRLHVERLYASAAAARVPTALAPADVEDEVGHAVRAAGISDAMVRITLTGGVGALELLPRETPSPTRIVAVSTLPQFSSDLYARGLSARVVRTTRSGDAAAVSGAKLTNYLPNILALAEAREHGDAEAILVDSGGRALQGGSSNLFMVAGGRLITPRLEGATLAGITRRHILALARSRAMPVKEDDLEASALQSADELFFTSSLREVVACVQVNGGPIADGVPGPVTLALHQAFRDLVGCTRARTTT